MDFPHGETVTVRSVVTTTDDHGDTTTVVTEEAWGPIAIAPRASDERTDPQAATVLTGLTLLGPSRPFNSDDEVVIASGVYAGTWQIEGIPGDWQSPFTGWHPGVEVAVTKASAV